MKRFFAALIIFACLNISPARAGFEWIPPVKMDSVPQEGQQQVTMPEMTERQPLEDPSMAVPVPEVTSFQENTMPMAGNDVNSGPQPIIPVHPSENVPYPSNTAQGLVIDPYPLQNREAQRVTSSIPDPVSIDQAMMEKGGVVHPMPLGEFMDTGVRVRNAPVPGTVELAARSSAPRAPQGQMNQNNTMIPLPDSNQGQDLLPQATNTPEQNYAEDVEGFGRNLPLVLALNQVVPSGYAYAFSQDVDPGTIVSWQGGKPWTEVLEEMLGPTPLGVSFNENRILITRK